MYLRSIRTRLLARRWSPPWWADAWYTNRRQGSTSSRLWLDRERGKKHNLEFCAIHAGGMMKRQAIILGIAALAGLLAACGKKEESLSLLVWEGYADPTFVHAFEKSHHCKVVASYMGSSDELVAKLRGGSASNYDVISPSSDVATSIARASLAAPLDLSKLPSYSQLSSKLRESPLVKLNGQTYGVPFMLGPNPLLYDTAVVAQPPNSWPVFWEPKFRSKLSESDELSALYMSARILGYDKPDPGHLYNLSDAQLDALKTKLLELKPNIRKMWPPRAALPNHF